MSREADRLQVVIEGDNKKLKQSAQESKKVVQDLAKSTDSALKQVRTNPLRDALKGDPAADGWRKQLDAVKSTIQQSMAQVDAMRSAMRNFTTEAKLQAGLIRPTEAYKQVTEDIRTAEAELARLREQEKAFPDEDKYAESERFTQMRKAAESSREELEKLQSQLDKLDAAGKSAVPTPEYQEVDTHLNDAQSRLNALLEKQKNWQALGFGTDDGGAMQSLKADIEEVTKEISYLKGEIRDLENTGKAVQLTPEAQELENKISKASEALAKYEAACGQMKADGTWQSESQKYHAVTAGIEEATSKLKQYQAEKMALEGSRNDYTPASKGFSAGNDFEKIGAYASAAARKIRAMKETVAETVRQIPVLGRTMSNAAYLGSKAFGAMRAAAKKVGPAIRTVSGAAASLIKRFSSGIPILRRFQNEVSGAGNAAGRSGNGFNRGLKSLLLYGVGMRAVYAVVNTLRSALSTGLTSLAQYSSTTNANLSLLKSQLNQLQGAFASAFAPILNVVTPALSTLIDYLISACNAVAQFMAALTGQGTYSVAKRGAADFASGASVAAQSAENATDKAEKLKRTLMSFDEINKLDDTSSGGAGSGGGGGGGAGGGIGFETEEVENQFKDLAEKIKKAWSDADFTEIGTMIGEKLKAGLDNVPWDKIKGTAAKIGKSLATLINGFVETSGLDDSVGRTVGELLNTGVAGVSGFMKNLHWESAGAFIAGSMNSFIRTADWSGAGGAVRDGINGVFKLAKTWSEEFEFDAAGDAIKRSLNSALKGIKWSDAITASSNIGKGIASALNKVITPETFDNIGSTVASAVNTAVAGAKSFLETADFKQYASAIASGINTSIKKTNWKEVGNIIGEGLQAALDFVSTLISGLKWGDIKQALQDLWKGISEKVDMDKVGKIMVTALGAWLAAKAATSIGSAALKQTGSTIVTAISGALVSAVSAVGLGPVAIAIGAALAAIFVVPKVVEWLKGVDWNALGKKISSLFSAGIKKIQADVQAGVELVKKGWHTLTGWLSDLGSAIAGGIQAGVSLIKKGWYTLTGWLSDLGSAIAGGIQAGVSLIKKGWYTLTGWLSDLGSAIAGGIQVGVSLVKKGWYTLTGWLSDLGSAITGGIQAGVSLVKKGWYTLTGWLSDLGSAITGGIQVGVSLVKKGWTTITGWLSNLGDTAKEGVIGVGVKIINAAKEWWQDVKDFWGEATENQTLEAYVEVNPGSMGEGAETPEGDASNEYTIHINGDNSGLKESADESAEYLNKHLPGETSTDIEATDNTKPGVDSANKNLDKITPERMSSIVLQMNKEKWDKKYAELEELCKNKEIRQKLGLDTSKATETRRKYRENVSKTSLIAKFGLNTSLATETRRKYSQNVASSKMLTRLGISTGARTIHALIRSLVYGFTLGVPAVVSTGSGTFRNGIASLIWGWNLGVNAKIKHTSIDYTPEIAVKARISGYTDRLASGGVYKGGRWQPVTAAASGGTFSAGQFFLAREAGPELVGTIGGSTAVMNNNQIVSSVSAGVYSAVCAAMSRMGSGKQTPVLNVYVGGKKITDVVIEEVNNRTMSTGQCPILT